MTPEEMIRFEASDTVTADEHKELETQFTAMTLAFTTGGKNGFVPEWYGELKTSMVLSAPPAGYWSRPALWRARAACMLAAEQNAHNLAIQAQHQLAQERQAKEQLGRILIPGGSQRIR